VALGDLTPAQRARLVTRAAEVLRAGGLIVLPTETVYGVAGTAGAGLERLRSMFPAIAPTGHTWHAPDPALVRRVVPLRSPLHRRLLARLAPGPVRFLVPCTPTELAALRQALAAPSGVFEGGGEFAARVPDHEFTRSVLGEVDACLFMERLAAIAGPGGGPPTGAIGGIDLVVDDGPPRLGRPSTSVRLLGTGGWQVVEEGALAARAIEARLVRTILLVCTGNTCRSPMASAIGRALVADAGPGAVPTRFVSAGVAAEEGAPASEAAASALRAMSIPFERHRARALTRDEVARADAIWTMTPAHVQAVVGMDPAARERTATLDPSGAPIPDPIGSPEPVYRRAAEQIRDLLVRRLADLDRADPPDAGDDR